MSYLSHKPIQITNCSLSFAHKTCFENFTTSVNYGDHIVIIGRNGSGKSSLLKMLQEGIDNIKIPDDAIFGYVPQIIEDFESLSGGQRFNEALKSALNLTPNILLLDEPTNHLDQSNRRRLMRLLQSFPGTLIIISHDTQLLRGLDCKLWHINDGKIHIFSGNYDDYINEIHNHRLGIEHELSRLERQKKDIHASLMREEQRAAKSKAKGGKAIEQRKWPTIVSRAKAGRAQETSGRKKSAIDNKKHELHEQLEGMRLPEIIIPKFSLKADVVGDRLLVSVRDGSVGYGYYTEEQRDTTSLRGGTSCTGGGNPRKDDGYYSQPPEIAASATPPRNDVFAYNVTSSSLEKHFVLQNINLSLSSKGRLAIMGDNGSGKSTLVKAILADVQILKKGDWHCPKQEDIGYLDQHYGNLNSVQSVLEAIAQLVPSWSHGEVRKHLNDFLFRKNEEVNALVSQLSGGEKARLSLAGIAAKTPKLLILDEVTNNLDLESRDHIINVLKHYPGALIVISHDEDFLAEIGLEERYNLNI